MPKLAPTTTQPGHGCQRVSKHPKEALKWGWRDGAGCTVVGTTQQLIQTEISGLPIAWDCL